MNPAKRKKLLRMKQKAIQGVAKMVQMEPAPAIAEVPVELPKEELKLETPAVVEETVVKEETQPVPLPAPVSKKKKSS